LRLDAIVTVRCRRRRPAIGARAGVRRAFSLLEIMIAIGILGIGLVMVAAIFPVALDQHRRSTDDVMGNLVAANAEAYLGGLAKPAELLGGALVHAYPFVTLDATATRFDLGGANGYIDEINGKLGGIRGSGSPPSWISFATRDIIYPVPSEARIPLPASFTALLDEQTRYVWLAFARGGGATTGNAYIVFVCRRRPGQQFARQNLSQLSSSKSVEPLIGGDLSLPVPWQFDVETVPDPSDSTKRLKQFVSPQTQTFAALVPDNTLPGGPQSVSALIQPGSLLISQQTGSLYTVTTVDNTAPATISVLESTEVELPPGSPFAVWFVPSAVTWVSTNPKPLVTFQRGSPIVGVSAF